MHEDAQSGTAAPGHDLEVHVVRVFTTDDGALGNPLGIVTADDAPTRADGEPVWRGHEQRIASRLGFSETVFLEASARQEPGVATLRIFTPASELPFAGHPTVGTAWWLRGRGAPVDELVVPAGRVGVRYDGDVTRVSARASWAPEFTWVALGSPAEVDALDPAAFHDGHHYAYAWLDEASGALRSRMFAPDMGIAEDEATGAAAIAITARLGVDLDITQGRGSRITTRHLGDGLVEVGGKTVGALGVSVHVA